MSVSAVGVRNDPDNRNLGLIREVSNLSSKKVQKSTVGLALVPPDPAANAGEIFAPYGGFAASSPDIPSVKPSSDRDFFRSLDDGPAIAKYGHLQSPSGGSKP